MWLSLNIIRDMVDLDGIAPEEIAARLTMATAEIDGIDAVNRHFETVVTAKIIDVKKHPNADKLTVCDLDAGNEKLTVVCGAPNHKKGDIVALATVGTKLSEEFTVTETKVRGVNSPGMLCSEKELGLSDDHSGIMIFPADTPIGVPLSRLYPDRVDVRLEIDNKSITHRPDLWCHAGFAREIAALFGRAFKHPVDLSIAKTFTNSEPLTVTIHAPEAAPRYCGLVVKNIRIEESPEWLKSRVSSIGMRPINNVVDVTNYVMAEIGEPMHAFDRKKLRGNEIIVRTATDGEPMKTLDEQEHTLTAHDVVIADAGGPIALAGVMGGGDSEIDDATTEIVLEAANFNPVNIRRTANRNGLRTEAAIRFEKSLDPEICPAAIVRCYELIKRLVPEAEAVTEIVDAYPRKHSENRIETSSAFIRKKLGQDIDDARITGILSSLGFGVRDSGGDLDITAPTYRSTKDVSIPDDIVEEVGRIFGYDNITPVPPMVPCAAPARNEFRLFERRLKTILSRDYGLTEVSNYSFVGEAPLAALDLDEGLELRLRNPLSQEQDRLRRSLVPNIVGNIAFNQRYSDAFRFFELGRVYIKKSRTDAELASEQTRITGCVYAKTPASPLFYDARTALTGLIGELRIRGVQLRPIDSGLPPYAHPGRSLEIVIEGKHAGLVFELHPAVRQRFDIAGQAALFDVSVDQLFAAKKLERSFTELRKYPDVPFELSLIADRFAYAEEICAIAAKSSREFVRDASVVSVYSGEQIPAGKKSVSVRVVFAAQDRTLAPEEIEKLQKSVIDALGKKGYALR